MIKIFRQDNIKVAVLVKPENRCEKIDYKYTLSLRCFIIFLFVVVFSFKAQSQFDFDSTELLILRQLQSAPIYVHKQLDISEDQAMRLIDRMPAFAVYKDTYFITGIPLNEEIDKTTADATFQLSIRQRLTKSVLPFKTFLYLTYTQKTFWDIYDESSPFRDTNYNPGLGVGRYIIHNNKLVGSGFMQVKHESNGRDSTQSRSWNYLSFSGKYFFNMRLSLECELWVPYVDGENNQDLIDYRGLGTISLDYIDRNDLFWLSADINPRKRFGDANINLSIGFKISRRSNQYLFAQFYNGYGENLLDYNQFKSYLRFGICIKPDFYSIY